MKNGSLLLLLIAAAPPSCSGIGESGERTTPGVEAPTASPLVDRIDWRAMLSEHDMVWSRLPRNWKEAPFLGNGEQGTMMYQLDKRTLRWDVGCSAAHDHRAFAEDDFREKNVVVLNRGRHFIGTSR